VRPPDTNSPLHPPKKRKEKGKHGKWWEKWEGIPRSKAGALTSTNNKQTSGARGDLRFPDLQNEKFD